MKKTVAKAKQKVHASPSATKKTKRKFTAKDYIDDEVEEGDVQDNDHVLYEDDSFAGPKETLKKKKVSEKNSDDDEEDDEEDDVDEEDDDGEVFDPDEERKNMLDLLAKQREEEYEKIDDDVEYYEAEEQEEQKQRAKIAEPVFLLPRRTNTSVLQKIRQQQDNDDFDQLLLHEHVPVRRVKEGKTSLKKKAKPVLHNIASQEVEPQFEYDCVWQLPSGQCLVHLIGSDKLGDFSVEPFYVGFRSKMNKSWNMLYPFASGRDALLLRQCVPYINWYEFWIKPLGRLPQLPRRIEQFIVQEREGVLSECCEAFWRIDDGQFYLAHFAFFPCIQRNSILSIAFHVIERDLCPRLFTVEHRRMIMTPDVIARYPWKDGNSAVELLKENCSEHQLTYQELYKRLKV